MIHRSLRRVLVSFAAVLIVAGPARPASGGAPAEARWFKGNLHTHSLWSDGDDYPEMIAAWYKDHGYHFLAISDHNRMQEGTAWFELKQPVSVKGEVVQRGGGEVLKKYLARFGAEWVEQRENGAKKEVRLKPLAEYRVRLEEPGKFLMIPSEEITSTWTRPKTESHPAMSGPVHINFTNARELVAPVEADNALEIMNKVIAAVQAQRERTGQPMFVHINHPNFRWGITPDEMMRVQGEKFFEVYNGHPGVENAGDATRLGMDALWDVMLAFRIGELNLGVVYGVGVDDSHHYHQYALGKSNPGRGWVMVRARHLTPESMVLAMESGDFYASSGVTLRDVRRTPKGISVAIAAEPGVTYTTQFIGTRKGFDRSSEVMEAPATEKTPRRTLPHRRYSKDIGIVLAEVKGTEAAYQFKGDELYVRAKIVSSKVKPDGSVAGERETAWVQPVVNEAR